MKTQTKNSLMLMLCAFIWGTAFVAQSAGSGMGAYSFLAGRSWLAVLVLLPTMAAFDALRKKQGAAYGWPKERSERMTLLTAGLVCGTLLFAASAAQQIGITINPSTAKAGFLTAMLLTALDVPEETIMKDYMASNNHIDLRSLAYMARNLNTDAQETITVLLGANETWLDLAFHKIKKEYGSTDKYLSKGLHLTEKERDTLKDIILN